MTGIRRDLASASHWSSSYPRLVHVREVSISRKQNIRFINYWIRFDARRASTWTRSIKLPGYSYVDVDVGAEEIRAQTVVSMPVLNIQIRLLFAKAIKL